MSKHTRGIAKCGSDKETEGRSELILSSLPPLSLSYHKRVLTADYGREGREGEKGVRSSDSDRYREVIRASGGSLSLPHSFDFLGSG